MGLSDEALLERLNGHSELRCRIESMLLIVADEKGSSKRGGDVMLNQLDHNNRFIYTLSMFGREDIAKLFTSDVESDLHDLCKGISSMLFPNKIAERCKRIHALD